jgi:hypothetical protein
MTNINSNEGSKTGEVSKSTLNALLVCNKRDQWNRCDECGKFIPYDDFYNGRAVRIMKTPDSELTVETYETLCRLHAH